MPFQLISKNNLYKVINKDTGKEYSKDYLTKSKAQSQLRILNKYLNIMKGSGLNKNDIKTITTEALSDANIRSYFPNAKIVAIPELQKYNSIHDLMPNDKDVVFLLYLNSPTFGHWVLLGKYDGIIEYNDSYGNPIDEPLKWHTKAKNIKLGQSDYLTQLLEKVKNNYDIIYNAKDLQADNRNIASCGRYAILRANTILKDSMHLEEYLKMLEHIKSITGMTFDEIVSDVVNI